MADALGRQLLDKSEVVGLDEILSTIRGDRTDLSDWFYCVQFDSLLRTVQQNESRASPIRPPTIEITSIAPQGGKTHLLYLLTSIAVTPSKYGGREACVAIIDADDSFDIPRLAQQVRLFLNTKTVDLPSTRLDEEINDSLGHVYILKPENMARLAITIEGLPDWFLSHKHRSFDRSMAFFAIDSLTTPQAQGAFTSDESRTLHTKLFSGIVASSEALQCPVIFTTRHQGLLPKSFEDQMPHALRPDPVMSQLATLRLIVRRVPVRNIPSSLSEDQAAKETAERMKIVALGRFECVVNEHGLDARVVQSLRDSTDGFYFRITQEGLTMDAALGVR